MSFLLPNFTDLIDIFIVWIIVYRVFLIVKKSGGVYIIIILIAALAFFSLASVLNLHLLSGLFSTFKDNWVIVFLVLFQPEIRNLLSKLDFKIFELKRKKDKLTLNPLTNAIFSMSFRKIGALIVIENKRKLGKYIDEGEIIESSLSSKLLLTIFDKHSILHDGAAIIRQDKIMAVRVVLPLSQNIEFKHKYGTRHLAAIGITEETDALSIVVSEETGNVSYAINGEITTNVTIEDLSQVLTDFSKE